MLMRLLRDYLKPYSRPLIVVVVLQLIQAMANLYLPNLNADIINNGVAKGDTGVIMNLGGQMLGVTLIQVVCSIAAVYFGARVAMSLGRDVRAAVFDHVQTFSARELGHFGAPTLLTRTTNDVQQVQMVMMLSLTMMIAAPVMMIGGVIMALREDVELSGILLVVVPLLAGVLALAVGKMRPLFRSMQKRIDTINRTLREQITGIRVIRAFVRDEHERDRFAGANKDLMTVSVGVGRWMALMFPTVFLIMNLSTVGIIWFGGHRVGDGSMQVGSLIAFLSYIMQILMSVMFAVMLFMLVPRAEISAERINEVLDTESTVVPPLEPAGAMTSRAHLEVRDVEFRYPGAVDPVLRGVSFTAEPGETTAIIGSTGSGKTTLLDLIPRLYDVTGGPSWWTASTCATWPWTRCGARSGWCRRSRTCSPARSPRTCATAKKTGPTTSCGTPSTSRRPATSSGRWAGWTRRSPRAAPTSPVASGSGSRSPGPWCADRRSTCSTTPSRRSISPPTRR